MRLLIVLLLIFVGFHLRAQDEGFLSAWNITQSSNTIELTWTIAGGNTCEGTFVSRSVNGSEEVPVFAIGGICGAPDRPESYRFSDTDTDQNGTYIYYLTFGSESTLTLSIVFTGFWNSGLLIYFDSSIGAHRFRIDSPAQQYDMEVVSLTGKVVYSRFGILETEFELPSQIWSNGIYLVRVFVGESILTEKFMVLR